MKVDIKNIIYLIILILISVKSPFAQVHIDSLDNETINEIALFKIKNFTSFLQIIADKEHSNATKELAIEQALSYFDTNSTIEITDHNKTKIKKLAINIYLRRINELNYDRAKFNFTDFKLNQIVKKNDDEYSCKVRFNQQFSGANRKGNILYKDYTVKYIDIILIRKEKLFGDDTEYFWDVKLSDIKIITTAASEDSR